MFRSAFPSLSAEAVEIECTSIVPGLLLLKELPVVSFTRDPEL